MADQSFTLREYEFSTFFAPMTLTRWHSYMNLTRIPWRYAGCVKIHFLRQVFHKLWYYSMPMRALNYVWSLPVT